LIHFYKRIMSAADCCKSFWSREKFALSHPEVDLFHRSQWDKQDEPSLGYVIYRVIVAIGMVAGVAAHIGSTTDTLGSKWLMYMTNQGILLLTIHYVIYAGIVCGRYFSSNESGYFHFMYSISWGMQNAFSTVALMITVIYWTILHAYVVENNLLRNDWMKFLNVFLHLFNSLSVIMDMFVTARPIRYQHVYLGISFGIYYAVFSAIYWAAGGLGLCRCTDGSETPGCEQECDKYIYPILDWEDNAGTAVLMIFVCTVALLIFQGILYGLYKLRIFLHDKFVNL